METVTPLLQRVLSLLISCPLMSGTVRPALNYRRLIKVPQLLQLLTERNYNVHFVNDFTGMKLIYGHIYVNVIRGFEFLVHSARARLQETTQ
uniref:Putative secreted protein n=1 Tax=Panstrongylus lignarius TaxID=156445 RepID=A0A224XVG4_9HEMI